MEKFSERWVITQLTRSGPYRKFSFEGETLIKLEQLKTKAPNFTSVVDYVMDALSLSVRYQKPIRITPMLLVGDPGIGKSYFTYQLSKCLGIPERRVAMDNIQIGAGLGGSSYVYLNSETGVVFKVLSEESHISPLVILDEIDKAGESFSQGDPLSPDGINLITSAGQTAEQSIFHLHLHVVPRWARDGFGRIWPIEGKYEDPDLGDVAARIRVALTK